MASRKVQRRPGFEPAFGNPDPLEVASTVADPRQGTHTPGFEGPPCGLRPAPSSPDQYDAEEPTCPACAKYLEKAQAVTARILARQNASQNPPKA
jgi:hypothetical protein